MTDILNRILSIVLAFILLVIAPLTIYYMFEYEQTKFLILKEMNFFIDSMTIKKSLTQKDIDDLAIKINSYGIPANVVVNRLIKVASKDANGNIEHIYVKGNLGNLNIGDIVQVKVSEIGLSKPRVFISKVLDINLDNFEFTLAGVVK